MGPIADSFAAADCVVIQTLKSSIKNIRKVNRKFPPHPEDIAYQKKYVAAAKVVLEHFGG